MLKPELAIKRVERSLGHFWNDPAHRGLDPLPFMLGLLRQLNDSGCRKIIVPYSYETPKMRLRPNGDWWPLKYGQASFRLRDLEAYTATRLLEGAAH